MKFKKPVTINQLLLLSGVVIFILLVGFFVFETYFSRCHDCPDYSEPIVQPSLLVQTQTECEIIITEQRNLLTYPGSEYICKESQCNNGKFNGSQRACSGEWSGWSPAILIP